ncbi:hypothetical protein NQ314_005839 [Rhamnusium bicolor]|uniref:Anoctamin n=1 Tax=Rhamnusium bicolor TaxID=1586634 RepID=A0AAV8ZCX1_9CUCU|nr:hypothetical protein NQ314_005839 [Rhamnusium bicolor]
MGAAVQKQGCFFKDAKRRVDFVIVLKGKSLNPLVTYIKKLEEFGLELEAVKGQTVKKEFLLIHIPQKALRHFAEVYNVGRAERGRQDGKPLFRYVYTTPISYIPPKEKGEFTSSERVIIVNKLLENASYGEEPSEKGLSRLIKVNLIEDAYPLHDGPIDEDPLAYANDRQLLFHHWAKLGLWYKEMPLDMIQKYFGCEIAFYFAWLEFFNYMLLLPAILGTIVTVSNVILLTTFPINQIFYVVVGYDNPLVQVVLLTVSFFSNFICKLLEEKREQEYVDSSNMQRINPITGELESFIPTYITYVRITISVSVCFFMVSLILAGVFGVAVYELTIAIAINISDVDFFRDNGQLIALGSGSILQVFFIKIFSLVEIFLAE